MKLLAGLGAFGLLGGGLYATDALTAGSVYDKPYRQAYADLASMPLLPVTGEADNPNGSMVVEKGAGTVGWRISLGTAELGVFTARLSPVGTDRTRVLVEFAPTPVLADQNPLLSSDMVTDFARLAMAEQVDARLENRPVDLRKIQLAAARHLQANPAQFRQFSQALNTHFQSVDELLRSERTGQVAWDMTADDTSADPAPSFTPENATRPSVILPPN